MGLPIRRLVVACNENDVLDEFIRTGRYRVRTGDEVVATSSPSKDISKASNFERYIHHLLGDDPERTRELFGRPTAGVGFDLGDDPAFPGVAADGFVSGMSTHADRIATIRAVYEGQGLVIDPHTADGVKVGREHLEDGVAVICLETARPAKFAATIEEALGFSPAPPDAVADLLDRPQHFEVIDPDPEVVKARIAAHARSRDAGRRRPDGP
jgi:threonine synthase